MFGLLCWRLMHKKGRKEGNYLMFITETIKDGRALIRNLIVLPEI